MTYREMIDVINEYLYSGELKDPKWITILSECKILLKDKMNDKK